MQAIRFRGPIPTLVELTRCVFNSIDDTRYHTIQRYLSCNLGLPMDVVRIICQFAAVNEGVSFYKKDAGRVVTLVTSNMMLVVVYAKRSIFTGFLDSTYIASMKRFGFRTGRFWLFVERCYDNDPLIETSYIVDYEFVGRRVYLQGDTWLSETIESSNKRIKVDYIHTKKYKDAPWTTSIKYYTYTDPPRGEVLVSQLVINDDHTTIYYVNNSQQKEELWANSKYLETMSPWVELAP